MKFFGSSNRLRNLGLGIALGLCGVSYGAEVFTDYNEAQIAASESNKMLLIVFNPLEETLPSREFNDKTLSDPRIEEKLSEYVIFKGDVSYVRPGKEEALIDHPAFAKQNGAHGFAIVDYVNEGKPSYTHVVGAYPFLVLGGANAHPMRRRYKPFEPWTADTFLAILNLKGLTLAEKWEELLKSPIAENTYFKTLVPNPGMVHLSEQEYQAIHYANYYRRRNGLWLLTVAADLVTGSRNHAHNMRSSGFRHAAGFRENIAMGNYSGRATNAQWINSSGHYANIMSGSRFIGVGASGNYWCQRFR